MNENINDSQINERVSYLRNLGSSNDLGCVKRVELRGKLSPTLLGDPWDKNARAS